MDAADVDALGSGATVNDGRGSTAVVGVPLSL